MKNKKGGSNSLPPFCFTCELRLVHAYFNLARLRLFGFGNMYLQYAVLVSGLDSVVLYGFRKRERSPELSANPFHAAIFDAVNRLLGFSLPRQSQRSILYFQMKIFFLHPGKLGAN